MAVWGRKGARCDGGSADRGDAAPERGNTAGGSGGHRGGRSGGDVRTQPLAAGRQPRLRGRRSGMAGTLPLGGASGTEPGGVTAASGRVSVRRRRGCGARRAGCHGSSQAARRRARSAGRGAARPRSVPCAPGGGRRRRGHDDGGGCCCCCPASSAAAGPATRSRCVNVTAATAGGVRGTRGGGASE